MIILNGPAGINFNFFYKEIDPDAKYTYCYNNFSLPRVDLDMITEVEFKQRFDTLQDCDIIGGTFSRVFLDQVRATHDVHVLNFVRNPSAVYVTGYRSLFEGDELPMGLEHITPMVTSAAIDNITLSKLDYVTTIRFEDILKNGYFEFMGQRYNRPSACNDYNGILTKFEAVMTKREGAITADMVNQFNQLFSNFNQSFVNCHNDPRLPGNVFTELGYKPLTLEEILNESI